MAEAHEERRGLCGLRLNALPPVTSAFVVLQVVLYFKQESWLEVYEKEDVQVSWDIMVSGGQWKRLLYAHFFHFARVHIYVNSIAFLAVGNKLEKKIRWGSYVLLILMYGILTNFLYAFLTRYVGCIGLTATAAAIATHPFTHGFTWVVFGLRVIETLIQDEWEWREEPTLIYGFYPVFLPLWLKVWWPLVETAFFDSIILERCIVGNATAVLAFTIPWVNFRGLLYHPGRRDD